MTPAAKDKQYCIAMKMKSNIDSIRGRIKVNGSERWIQKHLNHSS